MFGGWDLAAIVSVVVLVGIFAAIQWRGDLPLDVLFLGGLLIVLLVGAITPRQALEGFANSGLVTVAALLVVAAGLKSTGVIDWVAYNLIGRLHTPFEVLLVLAPAILLLSAFFNNTPIVAIMVPLLLTWCRQHGASPSKVLMPISFITILGGICTLVGTSTNLIVQGLLIDSGLPPLHLFELAYAGVPIAIVGTIYILLIGYRMLPERPDLVEKLDQEAREYLVELIVQPHCHLVGKTVEQAGLRHLRGLFLVEIDRGDQVISPATPDDVIMAGDRLVFTGVVTTIVDLVKIPGLVPAAELKYRLQEKGQRFRHLCEAVVSHSCPLVGQTIREGNFRRHYNAVVIAVHRNGERLPTKIGDIRLQPGDTLLLQTRPNFVSQFRHSRDFYLVSSVEGFEPPRHEQAWIAGLIFLGYVAWLILGSLPMAKSLAGVLGEPAVGALAAAILMVVLRCLSTLQARQALDWQLLLTIGAAIGLARALEQSGAAAQIARWLVGLCLSQPMILLGAVYLFASILTEFVTNNAVAVTLFPIVVAAAKQIGVDPRPFIIAITIGASLSFLSPIGYATNLMVMGPGGYTPRDYLRIGIPMNLITFVMGMIAISIFWPFRPAGG
ncbi:MAG: SLC13 family permease [Thermoguttaceae bacterium]|nr:SLC13 family permease [Thermoguttaceae bacterium]MDW8079825.1 SLC13 family permease [Thermoguttaceae bacterium]